MSKQVRRRRGTTAEHSTFIGAQAEITVDTTKATAVVHDGTTLGGFPLAKEARQINTATGLLGGGDLTANRTISLNVPGLAQDAAVDLSTDYILTYDVAAAEHKRVLYSDFGVQYLWKVCRNESGVTITKGTPVYITGRNGDAITVGVADAANPAKMPAVGVVTTNLADNTNGIVVTSGFVRGVDAGAGVVGDTLYVAPGGGFTTAKPANPNLIQNVGKIVKEGSNGNLLIFGPGRTNDVPALADGHVFIGNSSGVTTQRALTQADVGMTGNVSFAGVTINEVTANESPFTVSGYSLTGSGAQSMFELSGTWNTTGTPTAIKLNVTDTASNAASRLLDLQVGAISKFNVSKGGAVTLRGSNLAGDLSVDATGRLLLSSSSTAGVRVVGDFQLGSTDLVFTREAAGILAQRNAANAQAFRVYNTYTDASNYERLGITWSSDQMTISTQKAGTGQNRNLTLDATGVLYVGNGTPDIYFITNGITKWRIPGSGHLITTTDNVLDIGASAARPRRLYLGGGSLTGSEALSSVEITPTWNTTGTPTAIKLDVTNTASSGSSRLLDLQVGAVSQFSVRRDGFVTAANGASFGGNLTYFGVLSNSGDVNLNRDAADVLAQRRSTVTQTFRVYNTYTDASNYEAVELSHATYSGGVYSRLRTITAGTGADNINLVLSPSGLGAIMAQMPDGGTGGGNARGNGAVDLQMFRSAAAEVGSGEYTVALGMRNTVSGQRAVGIGDGNVSSGQRSVAIGYGVTASGQTAVSIGAQTTASAIYSVAFGYQSNANKSGQFAVAGGSFSAIGDSQSSLIVQRAQTTDATPTELLGNNQTTDRLTIPNNTRWFASVRIVASTATATAAYAVFERRCLIGRGANAAATAIVGNVQTIGSDIGTSTGSPPAGWAVALSADTTNGALKIEVTGALATTIRWVAEVSLVEVAYA